MPGIAAQNDPSEASFLWRRLLAPGPRRATGLGDTRHPSICLPGPSTLVLPLRTRATVHWGHHHSLETCNRCPHPRKGADAFPMGLGACMLTGLSQ